MRLAMYELELMDLDICMCQGYKCPLKDECLRYKSKPEKLQTYFTEILYKNGKCKYYITREDIDKKLRIEYEL